MCRDIVISLTRGYIEATVRKQRDTLWLPCRFKLCWYRSVWTSAQLLQFEKKGAIMQIESAGQVDLLQVRMAMLAASVFGRS